ncbi:hypothetical protein FGG08_006462 [Glutinoglossum americanum]|uniref:Uncharacterized protein n=1 Tax=Glutinoglossum americanum TaxID=1670608 RepID=A0A9P8I188_9PEZI|nr:hypothetical protein FGG08_006462 [Glutinoglossum americanum]
MQRTLGLAVLHRHFDLEPGERLVEYNAVTAPWRMPESLKLLRGKVFPKAWAFGAASSSEEGLELFPYEFGFDPEAGDGAEGGGVVFRKEFVQELRDVLVREGLVGTYGVCAVGEEEGLPGRRLLEFTAGRTSVVVPLPGGGLGEEEMRRVVEATWVFPCIEGVDGAKLRLCAKECYGHKGP